MIRKRKFQVTVALFIIIVLIFSFSIYSFYFSSNPFKNPKQIHELNYEYDTLEESEAINVSEHLDYDNIFNYSAIQTFRHGDDPLYIDTDVIEHYNLKYEKINNDYQKYMIYDVEATTLVKSTVEYRVDYSRSEYSAFDDDTEYICIEYVPKYIIEIKSGPEKKYTLNEDEYGPIELFIIKNENGTYKNLNWDKKFSLTDFDGFLVKMSLNYGYICGGLCGWGFDSYQIIILDPSHTPVYILQMETSAWIS